MKESIRRPIVLIGAGGFAREVVGYLQVVSPKIDVFIVDSNPNCELVHRSPALRFLGRGIEEIESPESFDFLVTVVAPERRHTILGELTRQGLSIATFIHPAAIIAPDAKISAGCLVCPGAIVNAGAALSQGVVVNVHCSVGHGASIGENSALSPFCSISGDCVVGKRCFLGTRVTLFPTVSLGDDCVIDAHTTVRNSVGNRRLVSHRTKLHILENRLSKFSNE